jgi:6-phosphogluconolactonase (cycloisomerase 2 family)
MAGDFMVFFHFDQLGPLQGAPLAGIEAARREFAARRRIDRAGHLPFQPDAVALSPDGAWLICAHQDSGNLTVFRVDAATGRLTLTPHTAAVPACVCVLFYN